MANQSISSAARVRRISCVNSSVNISINRPQQGRFKAITSPYCRIFTPELTLDLGTSILRRFKRGPAAVSANLQPALPVCFPELTSQANGLCGHIEPGHASGVADAGVVDLADCRRFRARPRPIRGTGGIVWWGDHDLDHRLAGTAGSPGRAGPLA